MARMYSQCRMRRVEGSRTTETICWIPAKSAAIGNLVTLWASDGKIWSVAEVYSFSLEENALLASMPLTGHACRRWWVN